ncbi:MAG: hypothetical protein ABSG63_07105 [Spirochaetia bacterium]|jgi:hypothetical protein
MVTMHSSLYHEQFKEEVPMKLTAFAMQLLKEAVQDPQGSITTIFTRFGMTIQTNGKGFGPQNPKDEAEKKEGLELLESEGLINGTGNAFKVTAAGYRVAEGKSGGAFDAATLDKVLDLIEETKQELKASANEALERLKSKVTNLR